MTVESKKMKEIYAGNGAAKVFPVPFKYSKTEDIRLLFTDAHNVESAVIDNFEIQVAESGETSVIYPVVGAPIASGTRLTVYRSTPQSQIVDLIYGGAFNPDVLEKDVFDRVVMMVQELQEAVSRAVKVSLSSDLNPDNLISSIHEDVQNAEEAAQSAQEALSGCIELVSLIPAPTPADAEKILSVGLVGGEARYVLVSQTGGSGGGGFADYTIPATRPDGKVVVNLVALGHPAMQGVFNPIVNVLSIYPHYYCIANRTAEEFTVQIYRPNGTPGFEIPEYMECGRLESGAGAECGQEGEGSGVELAVSIPMPLN